MSLSTINEKILTAEEVAEHLRLSKTTIYKLLRQGAIRGFKAAREWRVQQSDLNDYMSRHPVR